MVTNGLKTNIFYNFKGEIFTFLPKYVQMTLLVV